jgi:drug/metabolite transporter (DMT)-like permease
MDLMFIVRTLIALLIVFILFYQARRLVGQPNRKRAFMLGAVALLCFTFFNVSISMSLEFGVLQQLTAVAGMALFIGAAVSLVLSLRSGEHRADHARAAAQAQAYTQERRRALDEKPEKRE